MPELDVVELAKQGNTEAIATLMNRSLAAKGISVKVGMRGDSLIVLAESDASLDRAFLVNLTRRGLVKLQPTAIHQVVLQAYRTGSIIPSWVARFDLYDDSEPQIVSKLYTSGQFSASPFPGKHWHSNPRKQRRSPAWWMFPVWLVVALLLLGMATAIAAAMKAGATYAAHHSLYQVAFLGDFLRGLEAVEAINVLVFAILGMGAGLACRLLPQPFGRWLVTAALVALVPGVFLTSSMVQYQIWVTHLADAETLPYVQAREVADTFLKNRMGQDGFLGFYLYTARYPLIPERASDMGEIEALRQEVTTRIGKVTQLSSPVVSLLFSLCAWGLRSFYFVLSVLTTILHFQSGSHSPEARSQEGVSEERAT